MGLDNLSSSSLNNPIFTSVEYKNKFYILKQGKGWGWKVTSNGELSKTGFWENLGEKLKRILPERFGNDRTNETLVQIQLLRFIAKGEIEKWIKPEEANDVSTLFKNAGLVLKSPIGPPLDIKLLNRDVDRCCQELLSHLTNNIAENNTFKICESTLNKLEVKAIDAKFNIPKVWQTIFSKIESNNQQDTSQQSCESGNHHSQEGRGEVSSSKSGSC